MNIEPEIKILKGKDVEKAMTLIYHVFKEYIAPTISPEAFELYKMNVINNQKYLISFKKRINIMYGAIINQKIVGIMCLDKYRNHITMAYVKKEYQRQSIGSSLFQFIVKDLKKEYPDIKKLTLNSSMNAITFYEKLGFSINGKVTISNGIKIVPMITNI